MYRSLFKLISVYVISICLFFSATLYAESWGEFIANLRQDALAHGISSALFDNLFNDMQPGQAQLKLSKNQPEKRLTFLQYRDSRVDNYRIVLGQRAYKKNQALFSTLQQDFGVDPAFVVAIWGMETSYGNFTGNFPVIRSLATLAYQSHRREFFRSELILALQILDEGHVTAEQFKGEWAGASGQTQFLPSSWYKYAVDFDQDGRKNIWTSTSDALASIANYLKMNGWEAGQPWGVEVSVNGMIPSDMIGLKVQRPLSYWLDHGVVIVDGQRPNQDLMASLIEPDGGPNFLVFNNFRVVLRYNNSTYYAASVAYLADKISGRVT